MRTKLKAISGEKRIFTAKLQKFAAKKGKTKLTVALLLDLRLDGELMADHLWLPKHHFPEWMLGGDLTFRAKVIWYKKNINHPLKKYDLTLDSISIRSCELPQELTQL